MKAFSFWVFCAITIMTTGCQSKDGDAPSIGNNQLSTSYLVLDEPVDAIPVGEAREIIQDGQDITLVGRIGGSGKPFIDGLAAFTVVDPKVPYCADEEGCPTPWDYCCQTDAVKKNIATVKIVDNSGQTVARNARDLLNVKELSMVVVKGKAKRDEQGNLTVAASQIFVRPGK